MNTKYTLTIVLGLLSVILVGYAVYATIVAKSRPSTAEATPNFVTLSGVITCLPHSDTSGPQTTECAVGLKSDEGVYYALIFGTTTSADQFSANQHLHAEGYVVSNAALSTDAWKKYTSDGVFTITKVLPATNSAGKLNIDAVCQAALAYTTFKDGSSSDAFIADCKQGKHPEVIERYKMEMGLGDGAMI